MGGDITRRIPLPQADNFNPRPRVGDPVPRGGGKGAGNFNPRPPCGGDRYTWAGLASAVISIRPRVGRRYLLDLLSRINSISIHAPRVGATSLAEGQEDILRHFNPRPRVGRLGALYLLGDGHHFNPRPRVGATPWHYENPGVTIISITPPCGGDHWAGFLLL